MSDQLVITLSAATIGFVAAIFFCIGNLFNTSRSIWRQSSMYWDFSDPVAHALSAQRAQYTVGAFLLIIAFLLQIFATLASPSASTVIPHWLQNRFYLVLAVFVPITLVALFTAWSLYKLTMRKVLRIDAEEPEEKECPVNDES